ncbi:MAG: bifunctional adenosylcobinamide kinase/adenosylcobinamide-phosphate guanylyltransferase [Bacteroidetes bacterium]|nr:bifunctional adenosylcobinamide kinase/adenosylcobinamide-phosphate guanylyltransferase [Fibrella sp.]
MQPYLHLITGGARSGKSRYASELARQLSHTPVYVATAKAYDDSEFADRIQRHQRERGPEWTNFEEQRAVSQLPLAGRVVVVDCMTLWLTNFFGDTGYAVDPSLALFRAELDALRLLPAHLLVVTNEIGMGVHAETAVGRRFTDLQGWANQYVASRADAVTLLVSGIPVPIKTPTP